VRGLAVDKRLACAQQQRLLLAEHVHVLNAGLEALARIEEERALALAQLALSQAQLARRAVERIEHDAVLTIRERRERHLADHLLVHVGYVRRRLCHRHQPLLASFALGLGGVGEGARGAHVQRLAIGEHVRVDRLDDLLVDARHVGAHLLKQPLLAGTARHLGAVDGRLARAQLERLVRLHDDGANDFNHLHLTRVLTIHYQCTPRTSTRGRYVAGPSNSHSSPATRFAAVFASAPSVKSRMQRNRSACCRTRVDSQ
jgi:hypothetical protein